MAEPPASHSIATLYSTEVIAARVDALARSIAACDLRALLIVAVLKGSFIFVADLVRALAARNLSETRLTRGQHRELDAGEIQ